MKCDSLITIPIDRYNTMVTLQRELVEALKQWHKECARCFKKWPCKTGDIITRAKASL